MAHLDGRLYSGVSHADQVRLQQAWKHTKRQRKDYQVARNGDHLITPFECDFCEFWKLKHWHADVSNAQDRLLLACIRQSTLDALWSRANITVGANLRLVREQISLSKNVRLTGPFEDYGPAPAYDYCGREVAIAILLKSRWKTGKNSDTHLQFNTVRRLRSSYGNYIRASTLAGDVNLSMVDSKGKYSHLNKDPCGSLWFQRFMQGIQNRMGQISFPNLAMSTPLLLNFFKAIETRIEETESGKEKHDSIIMATYCVILYVISLRGNEGLLLDLKSINEHWKSHDASYVIIGLLGRYKGENQDYTHLVPYNNQTNSGLKIRQYLKRAVETKRKFGFTDGPLISDTQGLLWSTRNINEMMSDVLRELFLRDRTLFDIRIKTIKNVEESYKSYRTF